ncbi:UNVERIFIED_CONTAM: hypothetical protein GTU68_001590, partial [Idotea baltica]|nr:hypothetical protein [Idotea baltica]
TVTLVGLRGSGKTTVGKLLAQKLGVSFVDLDQELTECFGLEGESTGELLSRVGEEEFRDLEERALADCLERGIPQVLATGGGAVLRLTNRRLLIERSFCVWLQASPEELSRRVHAQAAESPEASVRPALTDLDPLEEMRHLAETRREHYAAVAGIPCDTASRSPEEVAAEIFSKLPQ